MSALARFRSFGPQRVLGVRPTLLRSLIPLRRRFSPKDRVAPAGGPVGSGLPRSLIRFGAMRAGGDTPRRLPRGGGLPLVLRAGLMTIAAAALAAGGLGAASGLLASRTASGAALSGSAPAPRWTEIRHPLALYDLAGTDFSKLPAAYRARRREPDGAREDVMTFGRLGDAKPYLQMSLLRVGTEEAGEGLADGLARLAGTRGLMATRIHPAAPMDTRLGRFEAADLLLWDGAASTPCLGFRGDGPVLRVAGFACGAPGHPMGRAALACAIDRIDLVSAGDDAALRAVFVAAERRGGATCLGGPSLAAGGAGSRGLGWLDPDGDMPPLRGLFAATNRQR